MKSWPVGVASSALDTMFNQQIECDLMFMRKYDNFHRID